MREEERVMSEEEAFVPDSVKVVLASGSPRRRELLAREGIPFVVHVSEVDESLEPDLLANPEEAAKKLAERKAGVVVQDFFNDTATTEISTLSLHDALPIAVASPASAGVSSTEDAE